MSSSSDLRTRAPEDRPPLWQRVVPPVVAVVAVTAVLAGAAVLVRGLADRSPAAGGVATNAPATSQPLVLGPTTRPTGLPLGETVRYDDGLEVTVTRLKDFRPSSTAEFTEAEDYAAFRVELRNGTGGTVRTGRATVALDDGGAMAAQVFDVGKEFVGAPDVAVPAGGSVAWKVGFGVASDDLVLRVRPDFGHPEAVWAGGR